MTIAINPARLIGPWREGFSLDAQITNSNLVGYDGAGHARFDSTRTPIGELLFRLKYRNDQAVVDDIADAAANFLNRFWDPAPDLMVPATSSSERSLQPVTSIAKALAKRTGFLLSEDCVRRTQRLPQLKNIGDYKERARLLKDLHEVESDMTAGKRILIVDDLYQSGATLAEITGALYASGRASDVFVLTISRAKA